MSACKLSIVCPAYEEEEVLPLFHAELCAVLASLGDEYEIEILYVDDGSRDSTLEVLRALARQDPRVRYLSLSRNFGHQAALTAGLEHSCGDVVISLDADLQHPPVLIPTLLAHWRDGYDVVLTLRGDDARLGLFKRLTSRTFYQLMRWLSDTEVRASASDFRLLSRKALDGLLCLRESHRFLRGMVNWVGFRTTCVPFTPATRGAGVSKYTLRRMLTFAGDGLVSFSNVPLRASLALGGALLLLGVLYGVVALPLACAGLLSGGVLGHLLETTLLLVGGGVLAGLGVVGEYVGRVYEQVKGRPIYLLKESSLPAPGSPARQAVSWGPNAHPARPGTGEASAA